MDAPLVRVAANRAVLQNGSLVTMSEVAKQLRPGVTPNAHVILAIDGDVPAHVVRSVVTTASRSGYPAIDVMVLPVPKG